MSTTKSGRCIIYVDEIKMREYKYISLIYNSTELLQRSADEHNKAFEKHDVYLYICHVGKIGYVRPVLKLMKHVEAALFVTD